MTLATSLENQAKLLGMMKREDKAAKLEARAKAIRAERPTGHSVK